MGLSPGGSWRERRSRVESSPSSAAPSLHSSLATRAGGPKNSPQAQSPAAPVTFWQEGRPPAPRLISQGTVPRVPPWPPGSGVPPAQLSVAMQKSRGTRSEDAGTRAPPSPGVGAGGGAPAAVAGAPVFLRPLKNAAVCAGSDVRLRVVVSAPARADPRAQLPDAGVYSCAAQNERGQASCEAVLTVLEVGGNGQVGAAPGREGLSRPRPMGMNGGEWWRIHMQA
ncbi:hypothetical protein P7K49_013581 [Saguinus oedipus]|uniref:Uncharacterized protein n=1 Tax=Saguinus oedipus TaxID=9490 RepID=A0ABQ9VGB5_SAGOE|nr:hypothetical protein P7K49_013581 [Saguinus oedipus]